MIYELSQCPGQFKNTDKNKKHKLEYLLKIQQIGMYIDVFVFLKT